ncbi:signal peptidase I [Tumebacillus permanentifrigoris]|uniref:Signal peptidase I n=1 Tax=Tumebacillus permanentifrigoris TaxID=378543 RepID=A0A316DAN4_9BACL|nr:signal peptidase I [Tumebacillus permanentifrigoris]PWK14388.1 signal peptidase I [Tumebacillus permanentifrigoris]
MFTKIRQRWLRELFNWTSVVLIAFLLNLVIRDHVFALTRIEGTSMMPTLHDDTRVYLNRLAYTFENPKHGDVVVFPAPHDTRDFIKRIIGLPGDVVEMRDGHLFVNRTPQDETYIDTVTEDFPPVTVAPGCVFVMGDNRHPLASMDSRDQRVGLIEIATLKGRVDYILYPAPHSVTR